jgi:hypothetical protein
MEMLIKTSYKLLKIENGIAKFDIKLTYSFNTSISDKKFKGTGSGKGTMSYDVANQFYTFYQITSDMQMAMKIEDITMLIKVATSVIQTTSLETQ